jgi:hypothetical protein
MTPTVPTIGRIVHYTLSAQDATAINAKRDPAHSNQATSRTEGGQLGTWAWPPRAGA